MNWIVIIWLFCGEGRATENIILGYFSIKAVTREDVRGVAGVAFRYILKCCICYIDFWPSSGLRTSGAGSCAID